MAEVTIEAAVEEEAVGDEDEAGMVQELNPLL